MHYFKNCQIKDKEKTVKASEDSGCSTESWWAQKIKNKEVKASKEKSFISYKVTLIGHQQISRHTYTPGDSRVMHSKSWKKKLPTKNTLVLQKWRQD